MYAFCDIQQPATVGTGKQAQANKVRREQWPPDNACRDDNTRILPELPTQPNHNENCSCYFKGVVSLFNLCFSFYDF